MCATFINPSCQSRDWQQGFTLQFGDNPNIQHPKGFTARLEQRDSLYYLNTRIVTLPDNLKLNIEQADDGTISAMIAPTAALTPDGPTVVLGGRQDYWTYNSEGDLLRIHKLPRKAVFQPERTRPVPMTQLEDYRRTIVRREDNNNEDITDQYNTTLSTSISSEGSLRDSLGQARPGSGSSLAHQQQSQRPHQQQQCHRLATKGKQAITSPQQPEQQRQMTSQPTHRYTTKTPPPTTTAIPHPKDVKTTADYWICEGHYWKHAHIQPRTPFHIPEQTDDGPDISHLKPWRQTLAVATSDKAKGNSYEDHWTDKPNKALQHEWTGSTNFEENVDYNAE